MRIEFCWDSSDGLTLSHLSFREHFGGSWWVATPAKGFQVCKFNNIKRSPRHVTLYAPHIEFAGCTTESPLCSDIYMQRFVSNKKRSGLKLHMFTVKRAQKQFIISPTSNFIELVTELCLGAHSSQSDERV